MADPPCPVCCANTRGVAAIAVTAAPVTNMERLIESIIGGFLDHRRGRCVRLLGAKRFARTTVTAARTACSANFSRPEGAGLRPRTRELRLSGLASLGDLVLGLGREITGVMAFMQLAGGIARDPVDHASAPDRRPLGDGIGPALDILVRAHVQEF